MRICEVSFDYLKSFDHVCLVEEKKKVKMRLKQQNVLLEAQKVCKLTEIPKQ